MKLDIKIIVVRNVYEIILGFPDYKNVVTLLDALRLGKGKKVIFSHETFPVEEVKSSEKVFVCICTLRCMLDVVRW